MLNMTMPIPKTTSFSTNYNERKFPITPTKDDTSKLKSLRKSKSLRSAPNLKTFGTSERSPEYRDNDGGTCNASWSKQKARGLSPTVLDALGSINLNDKMHRAKGSFNAVAEKMYLTPSQHNYQWNFKTVDSKALLSNLLVDMGDVKGQKGQVSGSSPSSPKAILTRNSVGNQQMGRNDSQNNIYVPKRNPVPLSKRTKEAEEEDDEFRRVFGDSPSEPRTSALSSCSEKFKALMPPLSSTEFLAPGSPKGYILATEGEGDEFPTLPQDDPTTNNVPPDEKTSKRTLSLTPSRSNPSFRAHGEQIRARLAAIAAPELPLFSFPARATLSSKEEALKTKNNKNNDNNNNNKKNVGGATDRDVQDKDVSPTKDRSRLSPLFTLRKSRSLTPTRSKSTPHVRNMGFDRSKRDKTSDSPQQNAKFDLSDMSSRRTTTATTTTSSSSSSRANNLMDMLQEETVWLEFCVDSSPYWKQVSSKKKCSRHDSSTRPKPFGGLATVAEAPLIQTALVDV